MSALTTRQRDLLQILLESQVPVGSAVMASRLDLTPRQVSYDLQNVAGWLATRGITLDATLGVGVSLNCTPEQNSRLQQELASRNGFQLVLAPNERRQLLALMLLVQDEPLILQQLENWSQTSRNTVRKDLDDLAEWLQSAGVILERRPNLGIWVSCSEHDRQQVLASLLWGNAPFGNHLTHVSYSRGLAFALARDASLLPLVAQANEIIGRFRVRRVFSKVTYAEDQLGGRFTDDAVLYLALLLAIQTARIQEGHHRDPDPETEQFVRQLPVWPVARQIAQRLGWPMRSPALDADLTGTAIYLLTAPRNDRWPGDLDMETSFRPLVDELMSHVGQVRNLPILADDRTLRDGVASHLIPACLRQRFRVWYPSMPITQTLPKDFEFENKIANELASVVQERTGTNLPENEIKSLSLFLRAACVRARSSADRRVLVVCPSGMATAQLLVARLRARFPHLGSLEVVSLRNLATVRLDPGDLLITTVPLPDKTVTHTQVIQVHPLLLPEDIETITQHLT